MELKSGLTELRQGIGNVARRLGAIVFGGDIVVPKQIVDLNLTGSVNKQRIGRGGGQPPRFDSHYFPVPPHIPRT